MSSRAAEFASAILIGVLVGVFAGAYLITMPYGEAADCLTEPKGDTAQGQHWYYRIEHGTKRHCWYLKNENEKSARVSSPDRAASDKTASRKADTAPRRSFADARAELRTRSRIEDDTSAVATPVAPATTPFISNAAAAAANSTVADDNSVGSNVMSRWPESSGVSSSVGAAPDSSPSSSPTLVVADALSDSATAAPLTAPITSVPVTSDPAAASPTIAAPVSVEPSDAATTNTAKYSGSLQELLVVAFAALALAGLTGNAVYRLARVRNAKQRYNHARRSKDWQLAKKARKKATQPKIKPEDFAPTPDFVSNHDFAPRPSFAPRSEYAPRGNFVPTPDVSEYAPKRSFSHAGPNDEPEESADDGFRSIEELLMRLAR